MDVICSARGITTFPTVQVWSRGQGETLKVGELEETLLALGVASLSRPARAESAFGRVGTTSHMPVSEAVDMLGVGNGGPKLTREGISSAMVEVPRQGDPDPAQRKGLLSGDGGSLTDIEPPAAEGRDIMDALEQEKGTRVEAALSALFAEPDWDDEDMPPPI
jgi:hypothetical protein